LIRKVGPQDEKVLLKMAEKYLVPLYGDQSKALEEWLTGFGHKNAYVAISDGTPSGFVYW
jgi:hypothetical protein